MDIIKKSIGLSKTIRNLSRLREIVSVFAKHGFQEFISGNVLALIPDFVLPKIGKSIKEEIRDKSSSDIYKVLGYRLRLCFEELGPAFIKFGQILSSREDIFAEEFINEMKLLRDKVKPIDFSINLKQIEASLGKKSSEVFSSIEKQPLGTASIATAYKAKLISGEDVVLKVRRPGIENDLETDLSILRFLAFQAERMSEEVRFFGLSRIIDDFSISLVKELNFHIEALNASRFQEMIENFDEDKLFYVPKVYQEFTRDDLIVLEYLEGIPFSSNEIHSVDLEEKLVKGLSIFIRSFLRSGFFHADLHGGNFFYLKNGQIGLIDFGLMGRLSQRGRRNFVALIYSLLTFNYENLTYEFLDVAEYSELPDIDELISDIRDALSPFIGLTAQQTNFTQVLKVIVTTLRKHQVFLPKEWFIVFRALMTLDGVGRSLKLDINLYALMEEDIHDVIKSNIDKDELIEESIWAAKDLLTFARVVPRHLKWFLKDWSKGKYHLRIQHSGHEESFLKIRSSIIFIGFVILSSVYLLCGFYFLKEKRIASFHELPIETILFWGLSVFSFVWGYRKSA